VRVGARLGGHTPRVPRLSAAARRPGPS
jgi:hypothetical protein